MVFFFGKMLAIPFRWRGFESVPSGIVPCYSQAT